MPKISVIIPVYNAKNYIERCLDSVCNQTLKDIEIICVNDCSTDNSLEILNIYANKYPNLKIIDCKENGGESKARNLGLKNVTGEYIAFVDNDDSIDLDFYEKLYNLAQKTNADIVKGALKEFDYSGKINIGILNDKIISSGNKWHFRYEWWCAIYKKDLIFDNNICLPEKFVLGGDCLFLHYAIEHCRKLEITNDTFYHWRRRENSGESKILSFEKVISALKIFDTILDNTNKLYTSSAINIDTYKILLESCIWIPVNYIFRNNDNNSKKECVNYLETYYKKCLDKDIFFNYIKNECPIFLKFFQNNSFDGLYQLILTLQNKEDFNKKNLFAKLRNEKLCKMYQ